MDRNRKNELKEFQRSINIKFKNLDLLDISLTHSSYFYENEGLKGFNEKLEFLGDAVLSLVITEYLYKNFNDLNEGELTQIKSFIISEFVLYSIASKLGIKNYLLLGKGEESSGGREKKSVIADSFEALIGAYYIDSGFKKTSKFIISNFEPVIAEARKNFNDIKDWKSKFQELIQKRFKISPDYFLISEEGPDHKKVFKVGVKVKGKIYGIGEGPNKKLAEQSAARNAISNFQNENNLDI